jgi:hypothetical protein
VECARTRPVRRFVKARAAIGTSHLRQLEAADARRSLADLSAKGLSASTFSDCRVFLATVLESGRRERPPKVP